LDLSGAGSASVPLFAIGIATGLATLAGGALALRLRENMEKLIGFGSGAVIGVALMDLLPEALRLGSPTYQALDLTALTAAGFFAYVLVDRLSAWLGEGSGNRTRQHLGPGSLVFHSLMDGLGMGVAFNVSTAAGLVVAVAVLAHDLMDGANTVTLGAATGLSPAAVRRWLFLDALAPLAGLALSRAIRTTPETLAALLAVFAGMFLYIGAGELLPRSRAAQTGTAGAVSMILGAAFMFLVVRFSAG
jgi:ZIP family zinc transporter